MTGPTAGRADRDALTVPREHALPPELVELLSGARLAEREGLTFELATADAQGWPHVALLSVGELLAASPTELRLALHRDSGTSANLSRSGRATLLAIVDGRAVTLRLAAQALTEVAIDGAALRCFACSVQEVSEHSAAYARLEGGIRFSLTDRERTLARWERTIATLGDLPLRAAATEGPA